DGGLDAHALLQDARRVLDLPASGARQVAREQGLELDDQREPFASVQFLLEQVETHAGLLAERNGHQRSPPVRSSAGRVNCRDSDTTWRSRTSMGPSDPIASTTRSTRISGAEAPAVTPTVVAPSSHAGSISPSSSIRCAGHPSRSDTSTSRREFEELPEPITRSTSHSRASSRTASCRLDVA